jgi:sialate O-acetylesterase
MPQKNLRRTNLAAMQLVVATLLISICWGTTPAAHAGLGLAGIFSDHMVLQRERRVSIWGWGDKGKEVTVEFAGQSVSVTARDDGFWQTTLGPMKPSAEGRDLAVQCNGEQLLIHDVMVGDVWHASGQSNMEMTIAAVAERLPQTREDIAAAKLPAIRFRRIHENESAKPLADLPMRNGWTVCSPDTVGSFSAAAFYFARKLHGEVVVPIGVIDSSRGGTPIEPFIPRAAFQSHPTLRQELALGDKEDLRGLWKLPGGVRARDANWLPGRLFHSRLAPIANFAARGAIWYQGESNCGYGEDPREYQHKMRALINGWREALGDDALPIYFVQLPGSGARAGWPYLREQQRLAADLPHTGMVVTVDLRDGDIHPPNKIDVGERLARWALADEYGKKIAYSGPLFDRIEIVDGQVTVHFTHAEAGLVIATKDGIANPKESTETKLAHFELADKTGRWHAAEAIVQEKSVDVRSESVPEPVAVRYAYAIDPQRCHLYNRDGLPAAPFCSHPQFLIYQPDLPND